MRHFILIVVCVLAALGQSTPMPKVEGDNFAGHHMVLPNAAAGKITVLIFGFSKASKTPTGDWAKKLSAAFANDTDFAVYQLPVLEDVPRLIRGMVISGIKKGVPENDREHFVPVLQGEAELKKFVGYSAPDDAYLVLLDRAGNVVRQIHGPLNDADYRALRDEIASLLK